MSDFCTACGQRLPKHTREVELHKRQQAEKERLINSVIRARKHLGGQVENLDTGEIFLNRETFLNDPRVKDRFVSWG